MGQAKQRGTAAERAEQAERRRREALQPISIDELRAEFNVPDEAEHIGFVVWLRERDEFLVKLDQNGNSILRGYGRAVEAAIPFATWEEAAPHAAASKFPAVVAAAFDMDKRVFVIGG